jgi:hypothetical protein
MNIFAQSNAETGATHEVEFVLRRLAESLRLAGKDVDPRIWLAIVVPVLILGVVYVIWMCIRESRTIGKGWAAFLAGLRIAVYAILAGIFLLPAWQTWDRAENRSKVLLLLDVSGSMGTKDDIPTEAVPVDKLLTRQDKLIRFLTDGQINFLKRLSEKNPVIAYRIGAQLDEEYRSLSEDDPWPREKWDEWLKINTSETVSEDVADEEARAKLRKRIDFQAALVKSTNLAESIVAALNRESNNMLQGIIVISDGHSTQLATQTVDELQRRSEATKIPIFTVGVGEHRQPIEIQITDLSAPDQARPDDKFPVRVDIDGKGLAGKEVNVTLEVTKPNGEMLTLHPKLKPGETAAFRPGEPPHAQVEFEIDKPELEGEWKLVAKVPADKREIFMGKEHVSDPATVHVVKKPIRVLLFAGGPSKDYQFARTLFVREMDKKRAEVSICLQGARPEIVQDVPPERLLERFPTAYYSEDETPPRPEEKYYNLAQYDVIVSFDADWSALSPEQLQLVERWVGTQAGGLVLVGGPINTFQLARVVNYDKIRQIIDLFPVFLEDSRVPGLGQERPTTDPWRLNFPGATADMEFLKLDEESNEPLAGWEEFFSGQSRGVAGKDVGPARRGIFGYYPVKGVKPNATVVATFSDPRARLSDGKEQPYLVAMPYGSGKVVYIGSGEIWRLRQYREMYFERFWTKLARYAGSGNLSRQSRRGIIVMGSTFSAQNYVQMEAQLFDRNMQPLAGSARPKVEIKPPAGVTLERNTFDLNAKPGQGPDVSGWFAGRFLVPAAGTYELRLAIPGTADVLSKRFVVKEANLELDNTIPDFGHLAQLASDATTVLNRVGDDARAKISQVLEITNRMPTKEPAVEEKPNLRLYFDLPSAAVIPECMVTDRKTVRNRGPVKDVWDEGLEVGSNDPPWRVSTALLLIIGLLSIEWLTRKLPKLA